MAIRYRDPETGRFISEEKYHEKYDLPEGEEEDYFDEYDDPDWDSFGEEEYAE